MATSRGHPPKPGKSIGQEFVDHRLLSRIGHYPDSKDLPRQLDMVAYFKDDPPCQKTHCTDVAVEQYNAQQQSDDKKVTRAVGVDSNMFILDQNDPLSYWHVYFKAYVGRNRYRCFAELSGEKGPELLRHCTAVNKASVVACSNCFGGIYHPPGVDFNGSPRLPPPNL
ncbi:hypothetical protein CFC21_105978 [Triticum aestivum]|uniref:Uncharacterized protein n=3 Tax=Triticum aestivum TaxID=4565 RepID=A0A3B6UAV2_WHEAT|nr:hypothetical protein CFC21_105978 [Triticum aestivum]